MTNYSTSYSNIQLKRGTTANWSYRNPILLAGEIGLEIIDNGSSPDTYKIKVGDGVNTWTQLPYYGVDNTNIISGGAISATRIATTAGNSVSLTESAPPLLIGPVTGTNIAFDQNEIQARANGVASNLYLQSYGGSVELGASNASNNSNLIVNGSLNILNGSTVNATVSSLGRLSVPNQPSFRAQRTSHVTATGVIIFQNVYHNDGNAYNSTNGRFTAPVSGRYLVNFSTLLYEMGTSSNVYVHINGVAQSFAGTYGQFSGSYAGQGFSTVLKLNTNDYIEWYFTDNGANLHNNYTHASAHFLG